MVCDVFDESACGACVRVRDGNESRGGGGKQPKPAPQHDAAHLFVRVEVWVEAERENKAWMQVSPVAWSLWEGVDDRRIAMPGMQGRR